MIIFRRPLLPCLALTGLLSGHSLRAQDYTVTESAAGITVTDVTGHSGELLIMQPGNFEIRFESPGRTFRVNGGPLRTGDSGNLGLGGVLAVTVNAGAGSDTIRMGTFSTLVRSLTINGGTGDDTVRFEGPADFGSNGLNVDLNDDAANPGSDSVILEPGAILSGVVEQNHITIRCSRSVLVQQGARLETNGGNLIVEANQRSVATPGEFAGVEVAGGQLMAHGGGSITVRGRGGDGAGGSQAGVLLREGAGIFTSTGALTVQGTGGEGTGPLNAGVMITGAGSMITSTGGVMRVTGIAGSNGSGQGIGMAVWNGGSILCLDLPTMYIHGTGGGAPGSGGNMGVSIEGEGALVSADSSVEFQGTAGPGEPAGVEGSWGIHIGAGGEVSLPAPPPWPYGCVIRFRADSFDLAAGGSINAGHPRYGVEIRPLTATAELLLHAADSATPRVLGLDEEELDRITAGYLQVYAISQSTPVWELAEPLTRSTPGSLMLYNRTGRLRPSAPGTDIALIPGGIVGLSVPLLIEITGTTPGLEFPQLTVTGSIALDERLMLTSTIPGTAGDSFLLVDNDGTDPVIGHFSGVGEGEYIAWPGSPDLIGRVSYVAGDGNDVVLTLVAAGPELLTVSNTSDSGSGSLRAALNYAMQRPGADTILLDPTLSGQTIRLSSPIFTSGDAITIDARVLPAGLIIDGGGRSGLFNINGSAFLHGLTLRDGRSNSEGGAIIAGGLADSVLTMTHCALINNYSGDDGGAIYMEEGTLHMEHCTLAGNTARDDGGAIANECGDFQLTHCTLARNSSGGGGGAICNEATGTLRYCLAAGNSADTGEDTFENDTATPLTLHGCYVSADATLLSTAGEFGGITPTVALLPGHPAIDAAAGSTATTDQRGYANIGVPDIGAFEWGHPLPDSFDAWVWTQVPATAGDAAHAAAADYDGDGQSNFAEWLALTDPASGASAFRVLTWENTGGSLSLTFPTTPARRYTLWETTSLATGPWTNSGMAELTGDGSLQSFTLPAPLEGAAPQFYRVQLEK